MSISGDILAIALSGYYWYPETRLEMLLNILQCPVLPLPPRDSTLKHQERQGREPLFKAVLWAPGEAGLETSQPPCSSTKPTSSVAP